MGPSDPTFELHGDPSLSATLLCGLAEYGLAGLTAVNYLVEALSLEPVGHVTADGLPTVTPFEAGTPRRHTRLFSAPDSSLTILAGELVVPPAAAAPLADEIVTWATRTSAQQVVVLSGVPVAHGPDDHRAFYIGSEGYQARHDPAGSDVRPMAGGFLDGVNGAVTAAGMDAGVDTCVYTTPVHAQAPDVEAALRLLDAVDAVHDLDLDTGPLREFADEVSRHYAELAERMNADRPEEQVPEDRMYM
jgi:uncharacterized protein